LDEKELKEDSWAARWLLLDEALDRLAQDEPMAAQLAHLRLFAGLSVGEAAESLEISRATAFRYWAYARAKLALELGGSDDASAADATASTG
jgi:DNA-directed RNA polymerase specialized sigma24 family protein